jgi:SAM-dependent methyltransferase
VGIPSVSVTPDYASRARCGQLNHGCGVVLQRAWRRLHWPPIMGFYPHLQKLYRRILPTPVRAFLTTSSLTRKPREWMLHGLQRFARHDEIYSEEYYREAVDATAAQSAPLMVKALVEEIRPATVIDVGCGTGQVLMSFREHGVSGRGLEYSKAALEMCQQRGLEVRQFDIEHDSAPDWRADLVVSTEVAEHLPERCADRYIDLLCRMGNTLFLTAATPDQGGTDHVNEQPNSYWIEKLRQWGFEFDEPLSMRWRKQWLASGVTPWYCNSAMLFRRRTAVEG